MRQLAKVTLILAMVAITLSVSCIVSLSSWSGDQESIPPGFFKQPITKQLTQFQSYDFETQYRIYIYGNQKVEPPSVYLAEPFAKEGAAIVKPLEKRLVLAPNEATIRDIILVFSEMSTARFYDVAADKALMRTIQERVNSIQDPFWKKYCENKVKMMTH